MMSTWSIPNEIKTDNLAKYDAVVVWHPGIQYSRSSKNAQPELMEYVKRGGNLVVQYNTAGRLLPQIWDPILWNWAEAGYVKKMPRCVLKPGPPVMNYPNKISNFDFAEMDSERGLYYQSNGIKIITKQFCRQWHGWKTVGWWIAGYQIRRW